MAKDSEDELEQIDINGTRYLIPTQEMIAWVTEEDLERSRQQGYKLTLRNKLLKKESELSAAITEFGRALKVLNDEVDRIREQLSSPVDTYIDSQIEFINRYGVSKSSFTWNTKDHKLPKIKKVDSND